MKAQKLGLVLGMNMAVACLMMQGCKAPKPGAEYGPGPAPAVDKSTYVPGPASEVSPVTPAPVATEPVVTTTVEPAPLPPSQVATVKPLPPAGSAKPAASKNPAAAPAAVPAAAPAGMVHVVKRGDTLGGLSRHYNVKMAAIKRANPGLDPNRIRVGQKITIPGAEAAAPEAVAAAPAKDAKAAKVMPAAAPVAAKTTAPVKTKAAFKPYAGPTKEYKVKSGDSLGKIAFENGITIRALKELNKLAKDNVRVGQTLLVPAEKVAPEAKPAAKDAAKKAEPAKETVKKPETAKAVPAAPAAPAVDAKKAEPAVKEAAAPTPAPAADAKKAEPAVKEAAAPAAEVKEPAPAAAPAPAPAAAGPTYTVKEGDDLVSVAIMWGISPSALLDQNDLKAGDAIKPGTVLKLPPTAKQNAQ